ncbi:MAG: hypothetical protein ABSE40_25005 [Candidatus Sulfotelmatobacter sp.]
MLDPIQLFFDRLPERRIVNKAEDKQRQRLIEGQFCGRVGI